jgi:hypothetical protein
MCFVTLVLGLWLFRVETSPVPDGNGAFLVFGNDIMSLLRIIQWKLMDDNENLKTAFFNGNSELVRQLLCAKIPSSKWYVSMGQVMKAITVPQLTKDFTARDWCRNVEITYHENQYGMWDNMNPTYQKISWVSLIGSHPFARCNEVFLHNPYEVVEKIGKLTLVEVFLNFRLEISTMIQDVEKRNRWLDGIADPKTCYNAMVEILATHL